MPKFFGPMTKAQALAAQARVTAQPRRAGGRTKNSFSRRSRRPKDAGFDLSSRSAPRGQQRMNSTAPVTLPSALATVRRARIGMADMRDQAFSYLAGQVWVGNGITGASGSVYFIPAGVASTTSVGMNPIQPGSSTWGQSYVSDVFKHFARKVFKQVLLEVAPQGIGCSSTTQCSVNIAPFRGGSRVPSTKTDTTAAIPVSTITGMKDNVEFPVWQSMEMDLTKYIAGGSGSKQNEFDEDSAGDEQSQVTPCMFALSGTTITGNAGELLANVYVKIIVDLLDFIGGFTAGTPAVPVKGAPNATGLDTAGTDVRLRPSECKEKMSDRRRDVQQENAARTFTVDNDDVKSLFEEKIDQKSIAKRSESIPRGTRPMPAPGAESKKDSGK